jgi:hypothetical protein
MSSRSNAPAAIYHAEVTQRAEERPPRFGAPVHLKIFDVLFDAPPTWWIFERLAAGDADMAERVTTALAGVKKSVDGGIVLLDDAPYARIYSGPEHAVARAYVDGVLR